MSYEYFHCKYLGDNDTFVKKILLDHLPHSFSEYIQKNYNEDDFINEYHTTNIGIIQSNQSITTSLHIGNENHCLSNKVFPYILCNAELELLDGTVDDIDFIEIIIGNNSIYGRLHSKDIKIFNKLHGKQTTQTKIPIVCEKMLLLYHETSLRISVKHNKQINAIVKIHQATVKSNTELNKMRGQIFETIIIQKREIGFETQFYGYSANLNFYYPVFMLCIYVENKITTARITIIFDNEIFYDNQNVNNLDDSQPFFIFMNNPSNNRKQVTTIFNCFKTAPTINFSRIGNAMMFIKTNGVAINLTVVAYNINVMRCASCMMGTAFWDANDL